MVSESASSAPGDPGTHPTALGRADILCIGPIILSAIYGLVGAGLPGLLLKAHPLILVAIRPTIPVLIAVGVLIRSDHFPLLAALIVPLPLLLYPDPFYFWAGRRYGNRLVDRLAQQDPSWRRRADRAERLMERFGVGAILFCNIPVVPLPTTMVFFAAGMSRMRWRSFLLADLTALEAISLTCLGIGYAIGDRAQPVIDAVTAVGSDILILSLVVAAVVIVGISRRALATAREQARQAAGPDALPRERGTIRRSDLVVVVSIIAIGLYQLAGSGVVGGLIAEGSFWRVASDASFATLVHSGVVAHQVGRSLWLTAVVALPYLCCGAPILYVAGRRYGTGVARHYGTRDPDWVPRIAAIERWSSRWSVVAVVVMSVTPFLVPVAVTWFVAGHVRARVGFFAVAVVAGQALYALSAVQLGWRLGDQVAARIAAGLAVGLALALIWSWRRLRRRRSSSAALTIR